MGEARIHAGGDAVTARQPTPTPRPVSAPLTPEQARREYWSERAAIREYDGGMTRADAERAAWDDVGGEL
jgi:hypothetical protein